MQFIFKRTNRLLPETTYIHTSYINNVCNTGLLLWKNSGNKYVVGKIPCELVLCFELNDVVLQKVGPGQWKAETRGWNAVSLTKVTDNVWPKCQKQRWWLNRHAETVKVHVKPELRILVTIRKSDITTLLAHLQRVIVQFCDHVIPGQTA